MFSWSEPPDSGDPSNSAAHCIAYHGFPKLRSVLHLTVGNVTFPIPAIWLRSFAFATRQPASCASLLSRPSTHQSVVEPHLIAHAILPTVSKAFRLFDGFH